MKISKADESSLLIGLTEALQKARIMPYNHISLPNEWERGIFESLDDEFGKRLRSILDDGLLDSLVQRFILSRFHSDELELPKPDSSKNLTSFKQFSDPLDLAKQIVNSIKDAPFQYVIYSRCLNALAEHWPSDTFELKISDRMSVKKGRAVKKSVKTNPVKQSMNNIQLSYGLEKANIEIQEDALYFEYRLSGIVTDRLQPKCFGDFYDDIKAFYGACISFGMFYTFSFQKHRSEVLHICNQIVDGGEKIFSFAETAASDISDCAALAISNQLKERMAAGEGVDEVFKLIVKMFESSECARLKTASIWLLRAHKTSRGMDKILDSTIAIEVLLGDREASDRIGLSKLMANRCAYALGKSHKERSELNDFFIRFYRVRSDIVHSGRLKLNESEQEVVETGTQLASRILRHETSIG
ncbi:MAG: hypothetical protein ACKOQM_11980 [Novosphingobium sp.]